MIAVSTRQGFVALVMVLTAIAAIPAAAQQLLYTPPPLRGSAQVRFVNATGGPVVVKPGIVAISRLGDATLDRVGSYGMIPAVAGKTFPIGIETGGTTATLTLSFAPDHQITVILTADGSSIHAYTINDYVEFNQVRSRLRFYNAVPQCAAAGLVLLPGGQPVFAGVKPGETQMRAVNPVTADVSARCNETPGPEFRLADMEVGRGYSVWLLAPGGTPLSFVSPDGNSLYMP